jgi:hypothetical protein
MENSLQLSPMTLLTMADEDFQILKHSNQRVEAIDPSVVAMKAMLQGTESGAKALKDQLKAHLTKLISIKKEDIKKCYQQPETNDGIFWYYGKNNPSWVYDAPEDLHQKRTFWGETWTYCTKCERNRKWVCTHTEGTHHRLITNGKKPLQT